MSASGARSCALCGCTELNPCETHSGPCSWVAAALCSACVPLPTSDADIALALAPLVDDVVMMQLPGLEAFRLLTALQLVLRHPQMSADMREAIMLIARSLQDRISVTPALAAMCESGWHPTFDVQAEVTVRAGLADQEERRIIVP